MNQRLDRIRDIMQEDVGRRGLATDPACNLFTECRTDFHAACQSIAACPGAALAVVTGFIIPRAEPPCGETDGPLGALFLARALSAIGIRVAIVSDGFAHAPLQAGLTACQLGDAVPLLTLPPVETWDSFARNTWQPFVGKFGLTHLIALERPGPAYPASENSAAFPLSPRGRGVRGEGANVQDAGTPHQDVGTPHPQPLSPKGRGENEGRYHTMGGLDITDMMSPGHRLFEQRPPGVTTIGIGDGGNEIGMGKISVDIIRRNIPNGGVVACRTATDHLIVAGISNWGAYALATGVRLLRGHEPHNAGCLYDVAEEERLLRIMVEAGPLVDGVTAQRTATVDGLSFAVYARKLTEMANI